MKSIKLLLLIVFGMLSIHSFAQDAAQYQFKKHWFMNLEGGAQYTLGEAKFKDLLSPTAQFGVGYQFNPWFAARLQANGWQSKGAYRDLNLNSSTAIDGVIYKYNYLAPGIDFMFNLSHLLSHYNPKRFFDISLLVGAGANIGWGNAQANELARTNNMPYVWDGNKILPFMRTGIETTFRLTDAVKFVIEGNSNMLSDQYTSVKSNCPDWYFNVLAGLRINLGKSSKKIEPIIKEEESDMIEPVPQVIEAMPLEPAIEPAKEVKVEPLRCDVFFTINSSKITIAESIKVKEIANYLIVNPKAKVQVTGYADAKTGNTAINTRIAKLRAAAVSNALQMQYGIAANRITLDSKGDKVQVFAENAKNRVAICIAE